MSGLNVRAEGVPASIFTVLAQHRERVEGGVDGRNRPTTFSSTSTLSALPVPSALFFEPLIRAISPTLRADCATTWRFLRIVALVVLK